MQRIDRRVTYRLDTVDLLVRSCRAVVCSQGEGPRTRDGWGPTGLLYVPYCSLSYLWMFEFSSLCIQNREIVYCSHYEVERASTEPLRGKDRALF